MWDIDTIFLFSNQVVNMEKLVCLISPEENQISKY